MNRLLIIQLSIYAVYRRLCNAPKSLSLRKGEQQPIAVLEAIFFCPFSILNTFRDQSISLAIKRNKNANNLLSNK